MIMKKLKISSEAVYLFAVILLSLSVAMVTCTDFGVSMIVAPAYILSLKLSFLSFGQAEYIVQALLLIVFCILIKRVKITYLFSFVTGLIYGAFLDLWRFIIPHFNPEITPAGSLSMPLRICYFAVGILTTTLSIALFFKTYIYPQIYDLFVKGVSEKYSLNQSKFKTIYDLSFLVISVLMTLLIFGGIKGIGIGTVITAVINGTLIGFFSKFINRYFEIAPRFKKFAKGFEL